MTSRETPSNDDAESELFLQRKGELARQLQALGQPEPSVELDAAISARVERELALAKRGSGDASNDPVAPGAVVARPWFLGRWRMPIALAASVMLGVFLLLQSQRGTDNDTPIMVAQVPLPKEVATPSPHPSDAGKPSSAQPVPPAERKPPITRHKSMEKEPPASPVMLAQTDADADNRTEWRALPPPALKASNPAGGSRGEPKLWLALIEELLKADIRGEALDEWKNFRKAHPQYPVPDKLLRELEPQARKRCESSLSDHLNCSN